MTSPQNTNQPQNTTEAKVSDKEINFRMQEKALQEKYEKQLAQERSARLEAEKRALELSQRRQSQEEEAEDDEPYVDNKKLEKKLARFGEKAKQETQTEIQKAVQVALQEERKQTWLKNNPDFFDVLQHAEKFAQTDPDLAESILEMPEGFERQKLVYKNIKALGIHKPAQKESAIQTKIDMNKRNPYYQPSEVGTSPYSSGGDFSQTGQEQAYKKMQELKNRLRI